MKFALAGGLIVTALVLVLLLLFAGDDTAEPARVPTVIGELDGEATQILEEAGFEVEIQEVETSEGPGVVIEQDPPAGTDAEVGDRVILSVAK